MKKYQKLILKIIVSAVLLTIIFLKADLNTILNNIKLLDLRFVPLIMLLIGLNYFISSVRWKSLLIHKNSEHISVKYLTALYFIGSFFNNFMPTSIGGDVYKIYTLGKKLKSNADAFAATFMERFTGMITLVLISYFGLIQTMDFWLRQMPEHLTTNRAFVISFEVLLFAGFWLATVVAFLSMKFLAKKIKMVANVYDSLMYYKGKNSVLASALFTSIIVQLMSIFSQYFIFTALGVNLPILHSLFVFPLINLAGFFIPSLNGLGVQDALYMQLFVMVGVPAELALSASILYHLFRLGMSLIGGLLYVVEKDS